MLRALLALAVLSLPVLVTPSHARGADDEPMEFGKSLSEWIRILEGSSQLGQRRASLFALGAAADHPLIWRKMTNQRRGAVLILETVGPAKSKKVLPALVAALRNDPEEAVRASAAEILGRIRAECKKQKQDFTAGRDALFTALRTDRAGVVREAAAVALSKLDAAEVIPAVPTLMERLKDEYLPARLAAADTLRRLGRDAAEAVPALRDAVADESNDLTTRYQAAQALGKIGPPEALQALPVLKKVLSDAKAPLDVRVAIAETIGRFGKDAGDGVALLGKMMTDEASPPELRAAAVTALNELGPEAKPALADLKKVAKEKERFDKFVRIMALRTFGRIGKELGSEVKPVVALLRDGTDDPLLEIRLAAIETLGNLSADVLGDEAKVVTDRLKELTESSEKEEREAAQTALKKIGG